MVNIIVKIYLVCCSCVWIVCESLGMFLSVIVSIDVMIRMIMILL